MSTEATFFSSLQSRIAGWSPQEKSRLAMEILGLDREFFIWWFDKAVTESVPKDFEEYTHRQLCHSIYHGLFERLESKGLVHPDILEIDEG